MSFFKWEIRLKDLIVAVDSYYTVTVPTTYTVAVPDPVVYYYVTPVEVCVFLL